MSESLQSVYRESSSKVRGSFGNDSESAFAYYRDLHNFVVNVSPPASAAGASRLLDVGCGNGWSTYGFAVIGYDAVGIDLNQRAFEPPPHDRCRLLEGSATQIPFPDESFDAVVCYACLEHVPDPRRALDEMTRVCKRGGIVAVVGPNLVSPVAGLTLLARPSVWKSIRLWRRPGMPRHPYGNTLPETLARAVLRGVQLTGKLFRRTPRFSMRLADSVPPFHADNDACYLCNPTDLICYFKNKGFPIIRRGRPGRPPFSYLLASGTWVAARKP